MWNMTCSRKAKTSWLACLSLGMAHGSTLTVRVRSVRSHLEFIVGVRWNVVGEVADVVNML